MPSVERRGRLHGRSDPLAGKPAGQSSYSYAWDEVGRLASATRSDAGSGFQITDTFAYAADGHRVRTSSQSTTSPLRHTLEVFDSLVDKKANTIGSSYQDDSTTEQIYLGIGGMTLGHLLNDALDPNGTTHVFLEIGDPLGSTSFVIDHDTGELVEHPTYTPNGAADSDYREPTRWDSFREDVRYTGHQDNAEVGLIYFGARYYNPQLGRWISPDPLAIHGLAGDPNPYAFVNGSPMGNVDAVGLNGSEQSQDSSGDESCFLFICSGPTGVSIFGAPVIDIGQPFTAAPGPVAGPPNPIIAQQQRDAAQFWAEVGAPAPAISNGVSNSMGVVGPGAGRLPSTALGGIGEPIPAGTQCRSEKCEETFLIMIPFGDRAASARVG